MASLIDIGVEDVLQRIPLALVFQPPRPFLHHLFLHVRRLTAQNRGLYVVADLKPGLWSHPLLTVKSLWPISTANIVAFSCKRRPVSGMFFARAVENHSYTLAFRSTYAHFLTATNFRRPLTPPSHSSMTFAFPAMMLFICVFPALNSAANFRELSPVSCNLITLTVSLRDKTTHFLVAIFETRDCGYMHRSLFHGKLAAPLQVHVYFVNIQDF